ncbi:hypothetical protein E2C01_064717 [Portunus trituberculatus]|uniref:Uncharacterized protein n=1 Tax=Portunus trituberculatus TaxID=210409 RepID=A0A5B7HP50_PORTR|nr:hypothetical protein [Portunus trituberculatus]
MRGHESASERPCMLSRRISHRRFVFHVTESVSGERNPRVCITKGSAYRKTPTPHVSDPRYCPAAVAAQRRRKAGRAAVNGARDD